MIVIGLTGGSGAGKGEVTRILHAEHSIPFIDTDKVYRRLTEYPSACVKELAAHFGDSILSEQGGVDRKKLASLVFGGDDNQNDNLAALNRIAHKHILRSCRITLTHMQKKGERACVVDAPLLFEAGFDKECDIIVSVIAPRELRISRIVKRDSIAAVDAQARLDAQKSDDFYIERADYVIYNTDSLTKLRQDISKLVDEIFDTAP